MGKIKKILENELVGGTQTTDVYPVTSTKAVYDENNERLDNIINKLDNIINKIEPGIIYDVSANNDGAVFESLQALLSSSSLNTLIPTSVRCGGMSIRFIQSSDNRYVQYRLASSIWSTDIHDWTSEDPYFVDKIMQEVNEAIDEHTPIEIHGDVANAPDEEDLTSVNVGGTDVLKFKDKTYNPLTYSGMGKKILRKNIVSSVNTLTQSMINQANTIYVIQYDFTLGEDITIPENCVLKFDGGSISGAYTITGTNTGINAGLVKIFNTNITLNGSWNIAEAYPEWFGAAPSVNSSDAIKKCIEYFNKIRFSRYGYIVEKEISFNSLYAKEICGSVLSRDVNGTNEYTLIASNNFIGNSIISINSGSGLKFANLKIKGLGKQENGINGIKLGDRTYSVIFEYCTINFCGKGFNIGRCWNLSFIHCIFNENFYSIYTTGTMTSSSFIDCVFYTSERALYFNGGTVYTSIIDCGFDGCTRGISVYAECNINIINCGWEDYSEYGIIGGNVGAKLVLYNSYIQYQEGNVPFVGGYLNIEFHDIAFPNGFTYACNGINFINCSNVPYVKGTDTGQIDYVPIDILVTKQGNIGFIQKGSKRVSENEELYYMYDRTSSIIYNNYLLIDLTIISDSDFYNGKIIVKKNGYTITNQGYEQLFSFRKSDGSSESTCAITFLKNCRVIINAVGRGITTP